MDKDAIKYQERILELIKDWPEEQLYGLALSMLRYCNQELSALHERVRASLDRMDVMEKMAELYRPQFRQRQEE